jgi:uncharacterized membrane protein
MWSRKVLKQKAKDILKLNYWSAFLVSLILAIIGGSRNYSFNTGWNSPSGKPPGGIPDWLMATIIGAIVVGVLTALAFRIFVGYALEVGGRRYFVQAAQRDFNMNYLGHIFNKTRYMDVVKAMLWRVLFNSLWFLLLFIPGIIKLYSYRMVPYILADNPNIGYRRALNLSMQMTSGYKFKILLLDLSFIGWLLLGTLALFVGVLFVLPYINAANAELYLVLRKNALENRMCSYEELNIDQKDETIPPLE